MDYKTFKAHVDLSAFVKCYWVHEAPVAPTLERQRIIPDGCLEMIFHYGDPFKQYVEEESFIVQPRCFVFGQITKPLDIAPTGITGIFSVCFYPDGFKPFSPLPMTAMENTAVPLDKIFGDAGSVLAKAVLAAPTTDKRIEHNPTA